MNRSGDNPSVTSVRTGDSSLCTREPLTPEGVESTKEPSPCVWHEYWKDPSNLPADAENVLIAYIYQGECTVRYDIGCWLAHRGRWQTNSIGFYGVRVVAWMPIEKCPWGADEAYGWQRNL